MFVKIKRKDHSEIILEAISVEYLQYTSHDTDPGVLICCDNGDFHISEGDIFVMNNDGKTIDRYCL